MKSLFSIPITPAINPTFLGNTPYSQAVKPFEIAKDNSNNVLVKVSRGGVLAYAPVWIDSTHITGSNGVSSVAIGGASINFADNEIPTGTIDGTNAVFTLAHAPNPAGSLQLSLNGVGPLGAAGVDFTLSGLTITYVTAPTLGSTHVANYRY